MDAFNTNPETVSIRPGASGAGERRRSRVFVSADRFQSAPALRAPGNSSVRPAGRSTTVSIRPGASGAGEPVHSTSHTTKLTFQSAPALRAPGNPGKGVSFGSNATFQSAPALRAPGNPAVWLLVSTLMRFNPPRRFGRRGTQTESRGRVRVRVSIRPGASGAGERVLYHPWCVGPLFQSAPALRAPGNFGIWQKIQRNRVFQSAPVLRAPGNRGRLVDRLGFVVSIRPGASGAGEPSRAAASNRVVGFNPPRCFGRRGTFPFAPPILTPFCFNPPRCFGRRGTSALRFSSMSCRVFQSAPVLRAPGNLHVPRLLILSPPVSIRPGASGAGERCLWCRLDRRTRVSIRPGASGAGERSQL